MEAKYEKATDERPARIVGVVADITNRKRIERRAQRLSQRPSHHSRGGTAQYRAGASRLDSAAPRRRKPCPEHREPATRPQSRQGESPRRKVHCRRRSGNCVPSAISCIHRRCSNEPVQDADGLCRRLRRSFWVALQVANGPQARQIPTAGATIDLAHRPRRIGQRLPARFGLAGVDRRPASRRSTARRRCRQRTRHHPRLSTVSGRHAPVSASAASGCVSLSWEEKLRISAPTKGGTRLHAVLPTGG